MRRPRALFEAVESQVEEAAAAAFLVEVVVIDEAYDGGGAGFEARMCSSTSP